MSHQNSCSVQSPAFGGAEFSLEHYKKKLFYVSCWLEMDLVLFPERKQKYVAEASEGASLTSGLRLGLFIPCKQEYLLYNE